MQSSACAACRSSRAPRGWEKCNIRVLCCVVTPALPLPGLVPALVLCREGWAGLGHEARAPGLGLGVEMSPSLAGDICYVPPGRWGYFCSINRSVIFFFLVFYWAEAQWGREQGWWDSGRTWQGPGGHKNLTLVCCRLLCNRGNRVNMEVIHVRVACLWILSVWVAAQWRNWCGT